MVVPLALMTLLSFGLSGADPFQLEKLENKTILLFTPHPNDASEWRLYFPNQQLHDKLEPWKVPVEAYFYVTPKDANYWVNIDEVVDMKIAAAAAHVSQFDPSIRKYRPDWTRRISKA
jgi:LmbE family N-acetylglucosaminyl deacetylase